MPKCLLHPTTWRLLNGRSSINAKDRIPSPIGDGDFSDLLFGAYLADAGDTSEAAERKRGE